jgi:hypothetical protein
LEWLRGAPRNSRNISDRRDDLTKGSAEVGFAVV